MLQGAMEKGDRVKVGVSIMLAIALLAFFLSKANLRDVAARISRVAPEFFLLSVACSLSTVFLRSWRWQFLLRPVARVPFGASFAATSVGFAASTVLPARAGEVVRPVVLARRTAVPLSASFASVLFERAVDLATVLLFFLFYGLWPGLHPRFTGRAATVFSSLRLLALFSGGAAVAFFLFAVLATGRNRGTRKMIALLVGWLPERFREKASGVFSSFLDGMHSVRRPRMLAATSLLSFVLWAAVCGQVYFLLRAFRLPLGPASSILVVVVTLIGLAIPTPGGVGGFHQLCQFALTLFYGVDIDAATGFAIVYWFVAFAPVTLIGFCLFAASPRGKLAELAEPRAEE